MTNSILHLTRGESPLLISCPHDGTTIPPEIAVHMTPEAQAVPDTDWHVARLYAFAEQLGATILVPAYSRYVVDLNRPPDDVSLYPGQNTTGLCPVVQFSGEPIYFDGQQPSTEEINARVDRYWRPYHQALRDEIARLREMHDRVVLWEAHSIRSVLPFLFDGRLPDINLGTAAGASCSTPTQQRLQAVLDAQDRYTHVVNGRFKGGYITRQYGQPAVGVDAIQLELAQLNYIDEDSYEYLPDRAELLQSLIRSLLETALK
ncbi:MAG: N-formylglutamate deformylase [Dokdonella sp.]